MSTICDNPAPRGKRQPEPRLASAGEPAPKSICLFACVVVLAGATAFFNGIPGVFLYDDSDSIQQNRHIRTLWPLSEAISLPLWNTGVTVDARPVLSLSFALNHRLLGPEPGGYHAVNIIIHLLAALALMGIVRRTLCSDRLAGRLGPGQAASFAFAVALLWAVHPLHTGSVTYIVQRAESLMGLLYLLTLYCCIRGVGSPRPWPWFVGGVVACWLGAGTKEVIATAPVIVLLWDVIFAAGSFRQAMRRRWAVYGLLAASWLVSAGLVIVTWQSKAYDFEGDRSLAYAQNQPGVILHYLRLAFCPRPLATAYGWPAAEGWRQIVLPAIPIAGLALASAWGLWKRHWIGFVGAWFFLILAPSSSVIPTGQMAFDHRMYLPLAAVVTAAVVVGLWLLRGIPNSRIRWSVAALAILAASAALAAQTHLRNRDFHDGLRFWADNVRKRPNSWMAHFSLGNRLSERGRIEEAVEEFKIAARLSPRRARVYSNLGTGLLTLGRYDEAIVSLRKGVELAPALPPLRANLAVALFYQNRLDESARISLEALEDDPDYALVHFNLGLVRMAQQRLPEARACFQRVVELAPDDVGARRHLARVLVQQGEYELAAEHCRKALAELPSQP